MGIVRKISTLISRLFRKEKYPVHAECSVCGERVYLPFHCEYCRNFFCGKHRLPFDHDCKNIGEWKRKPDTPTGRK